MFNWYKNYKQKQIDAKARQRKEMIDELRTILDNENIQKRLTEEELRAKFIKEKQDSDIPWFEVLRVDSDGTPTELIWNAAYIKQLNDQGFKGKSDRETIDLYYVEQHRLSKQKQFHAERELKHDSKEPWVEIIGESTNEHGQIELKLDWNKAFIKYLKKSGIKGTDEDDVVEKWLVTLNRETILSNPENYE